MNGGANYSSVYEIPISSIDGEPNVLSGLNGKVCLFVNIATKAGYSPKCSNIWSFARTARRLWELQKVHEMFQGFSVVAFPCNQFYGMEPLGNKEILNFIKQNYPFVSFPITEKIDVNGDSEHPVYSFLKGKETRRFDDTPANTSQFAVSSANKANQAMGRIPSNFENFIISKDGRVAHRLSFNNWPLATESVTNESELTVIKAIKSLMD